MPLPTQQVAELVVKTAAAARKLAAAGVGAGAAHEVGVMAMVAAATEVARLLARHNHCNPNRADISHMRPRCRHHHTACR